MKIQHRDRSSKRFSIPHALRAGALAALVAMAGAEPAAAASAPPTLGDGVPRAYALIVNGDDSVQHRGNVAVAAETLGELGVDPGRLYVLTGGAGSPQTGSPVHLLDANRAELRRTVRRLAAEVDGDDTLIVYTTGHGAWAGGAPRLLLAGDTVTARELARRLASIPWKRLVFIGDQCYSGAFAATLQRAGREVIAISSTDAAHEVRCADFVRPFWRALRRHSGGTAGSAEALPAATWHDAFTVAVLSQRSSEPHEEHYPQFLTSGLDRPRTPAAVAVVAVK